MAEVEKLINGYKKFYDEHFIRGDKTLFEGVQKSQNPKTLIISCSDSRIDPAILTNAEVGDIFVIRNVANLVPPYEPKFDSYHGTSAALEYAVKVLKVNHVIVLGHSNCGGIKTLADSDCFDCCCDPYKEFSFINDWIKIGKDIKDKIPKDIKDKYTFCEQEGIKLSLQNLLTFPWIEDVVNNKQLKLHGWYFSIKDASLSIYDEDKDKFLKI